MMGRKVKTINLAFNEQSSLEEGYQQVTGIFSRRCHISEQIIGLQVLTKVKHYLKQMYDIVMQILESSQK